MRAHPTRRSVGLITVVWSRTVPTQETAYEAFRICLGPDSGVLEGRTYTTLADLLQGRKPLSVHVKMDVEGSADLHCSLCWFAQSPSKPRRLKKR